LFDLLILVELLNIVAVYKLAKIHNVYVCFPEAEVCTHQKSRRFHVFDWDRHTKCVAVLNR
jgi:hypothetical protein